MQIEPFSYSDKGTPNGYVCHDCQAKGVALFREYNTFADYLTLRCTACATKNQQKNIEALGRWADFCKSPHQIGHLVAAVPTEEGDTYWGYTSVPQAGVDWWNNLPKE